MSLTPEQQARFNIDTQLQEAWWIIQNMDNLDISASFWIAVREFPLKNWHGFADYLLYVDQKPVWIIEAKKEGTTLVGVETQSKKYVDGLHDCLQNGKKLSFSYESTGVETRFTNNLETEPNSREVFTFHTPVRLKELQKLEIQNDDLLKNLPALESENLRKVQIEAITNLETSLKNGRRRALIQMATGTGKTFTFCNIAYRLIKHTKAKRILFLVDRGNLSRQAFKEFQNFSLPNDGRKFTEVYNIQNMSSNQIDDVSKVTISTIQRMYSMLSGKEIENEVEEKWLDAFLDYLNGPEAIKYNKNIPIDSFDYIVVDECHRSIYNLWRQVLEYFDAKIIGLTATPSKQTIWFFDNNLVMEYNHERAVADGVNVDFNVYKIETQIGSAGSEVKAGYYIDKRDKLSRKVRYEALDNDLLYEAKDLDRSVVALDQIRTVIKTFKENLFTEIFPGRSEVPKTLIFAKDDSHAEDIVRMVRQEFGKWNDFCQKITYKTTGKKPEDLINDFRTDYNPRIAVTVDMIATGTDIKPLEVVFFMRSVKSQLLFEQMKWRWVRVIDDTDFNQVTTEKDRELSKTHFVIVDAVWVIERDKTDTKPLDKKPMVSFNDVLKFVKMWSTEPDLLSTLVSRLSRISKDFSLEQSQALKEIGWMSIEELNNNIISAIDEDKIILETLKNTGKTNESDLTEEELQDTREKLARIALKPIYNPKYREKLLEIKQTNEQIIDTISTDSVIFAGFDEHAKQKAKAVIDTFKSFMEENKEELELLKMYYNKAFKHKTTFKEVKEFAKKLESNPILKKQETIWRAYRTLNPSKVIEDSKYSVSDYLSLLGFTFEIDEKLEPFRYKIENKFESWLASKENTWKKFSATELEWLETIKDEIANNISVEISDFDNWELLQKWGRWGFYSVFWEKYLDVVDEMNRELV